MSTRRVDRPYVRQRRVQHGARGLAELAGHAGSGAGLGVGAGAERATVERLEPRQLLFSLTIGPDQVNPATGLGTVEAAFGYTIPILQTPEEVADNDPESTIEGFDQEPLTPVASGRRFGTDGLAVTHTIANPVSRFFMFALVDNQGQIIDGTEAIRANPFAGETYRWRVLDDPMGPINGPRRVMTDFTMQIGAAIGTNLGWSVDALEVRLRLNGVVVREFIGQEILQARQPGTGGPNNGIGVYNFTTGDPLFPAFDEIEFLTVSGPNPAYTIDNVGWTEPAGNFTEIIQSRTFGAIVSFTGPVGANITVLDLYGRDMVATLLVGQIGQSEVTFIDPDDNGIPNFNDGIGQILLAGVDSRASLRVFGGTLTTGYDEDGFWVEGPFGGGSPEFVPEPQDDEGYFTLIPAGGVEGLMDDFEEAGFGVFYTEDDGATGLPPIGGSLIIGSPIFRPLLSYNPQGRATGQGAFSPDLTSPNFSQDAHIMPTQGIFVLDGSSMGEISVPALLYGSSRFEGALRSLSVGVLMGSVSVEGDLGSLYVNGDAGFWQIDPDFPTPPPDNTFKTGGQLIVGRTLGDVTIGGRSVLDVTVVGDVSSPQTRPPLDQFIYREKEVIFPVNETAQYMELDYVRDVGQRFFRNGANTLRNPRFLGGEVYRNDQIAAAEFISTTGTAVNVVGSIGAGDPAMNSNEDPSDVYAFASDGRTPVVLEIEGQDVGFFGAQLAIDGALVRFADGNGNTLAANSFNEITAANQRIVFTPEAPGIYYLIFQVPGQTDGDFDGTVLNYQFLLSGIAPTTFGNYLSAASTGGIGVNGGNAAINVLAGSLGLFRVGMGSLSGGGQFIEPSDVTNSMTALESLLNVETMSLSVARGNAYAIITGSDIEGGDQFGQSAFFIAGDLGAFITGQSPLLEQGPEIGDVGVTSLTVGGRVGLVDIRGGIGQQSDEGAVSTYVSGLTFRSGTAGGPGDVGVFRVGADIFAPTSSFQFAPGSTIGAFLVSQDLDPLDGGTEGIFGGVPREGFFTTGVGSDVRFVDLPRIDLQGGINSGVALRAGVPVELIDDGGATIRVTVTGGATGVPVGFLRFIPIDGSEGVALGQIDNLDLTGRSLLVETLGAATDGRVSIGRINLVGADAATDITFSGNVELDVWQIVQTGGAAFNSLLNETPRGDFVAVDVIGLNILDITTGNLGRTEVVEWGPRLLGPNLGLGGGPGGAVGGAIGVPAAAIDANWSGGIFRPANDVNTAGGTAYLDDIGGPFDGFLNGIVVRTGNVAQARVGGVVGDLILQGGDGTLTELVVNTDNFTPIGEFHGIVGSVYAANIVRVEVGDGLRGDQYAPLSSGTIMAANQIIEVTGGTFAGRAASISGRIWAANLANTVNPVGTPAVGRTFLQDGNYVDATIGAGLLDGFWISINYDDAQTFTGTVDRVTGTNANFFRSEVLGLNINEFDLVNGFFDASRFNAQVDAGTITAMGYRNSTLSGTDFEFRPSIILIGSDLGSIRTQTPTGDIRDTVVDVVGSITQEVAAGFITRSEFQVDNEIPSLSITGSIRGSKLVFGRLEAGVIGGSIRHSEFTGNQILSLAAGDSITNTIVRISGPNGRLDLVSAANSILDSEFIASGPIGTITTTTGDLDARIRTTTGRGTVGTLSAGRDLVLDTDISRGLSALIAGRHIGRQADPTVVLVRGNLTTLTAPNGQLYSDVRVGQTIGGAVTLGAASAKPANNQIGQGSIIAFGAITNVVINGDFGGSIISYTGGIASIAINNGSFLRGDAARPNTIAAYDGDITSLVITNGNLYGDVYADYDLVSLQVVAGADGVFGDIGVNPAFNANQNYDSLRNRVPVGVAAAAAIQGPRIGAGRNIISVAVTGGSVFEAGFHAGRAVQSITIAEGFTRDNATSGFASYVVAGDLVDSVVVGGDGASLQIIAGVLDLGADQRPGGTGDDSDILQAGNINSVSIAGRATDVQLLAGVLAGDDGVYNTKDDLVALGRSTVGSFSVGGSTRDVLVRSDIVSSVSGDGIRVNGGGLKAEDALVAKNNPNGTNVGASLNINLGGGERATLAFTGPGRAVWNSNTRTISLIDTTLDSSLVVTSTNGQTLSNLNIVTNDDASVGTLTINAILAGNSNIVIDADGTTLTATGLTTSGRVVYGGNLGTLRVVNDFLRGSFAAKDVASVNITGSFGDPNLALRNEATIAATNVGTIAITGQDRGVIVIAREANAINVTGTVANALIRVGSRLGSLTAGELSRTRVSVGDFLGGSNASGGNTGGNQTVQAVRINGNVFDSAIIVGGDLGADGEIGGSRLNADRVTSGFLGSVFIGGNFEESDIVAGLLRGPDGFFGTADDAVAAGRSTIGTVTIVGNRVGSNRFTESYRIASTGSLRGVTIAGQPAQNQLNFETRELGFQPLEIQVDEVVVGLENDQFVATIFFNQAIDQATLDTALSIREVRQGGQVQVFLISGEDYTLRYDANQNAAIVTFSRDVTEANLPITPGTPAVGVFNFVIDDAVIRGSLSSARLDGNGDGFARGDDYNIAEIVGDAGDKLNPGTANIFQGGNLVHSVDFYGPVDLDVVLDREDVRDSLPDVNAPVVIRGSIGDHADQNVNFFRFAGDTDLYKITLQAGQILQLGAMQGAAQQAPRVLLNAGGQGATGAQVTTLIAGGLDFRSLDATFAESYYIRQSGVYYIAIGEGAGSVGATGTVTNPSSAQPSTLGPYSFTIEVFDDFDSGFSADTDSGDGTAIVNAPPANQFTSPGQVITVGDYSFTLTTNAQGQQVVTGANSLGVTSTRAGGTLTTTIASAIGPGGLSGVPNTPYGDLDVYHLNNRATVTNGSVIRVTLKVSEVGGDLGSKTVDSGFLPIDVTSVVQLGIFDTTTSTGIDDGLLFASPSQFTGVGGEPSTVLSDNGAIEYGFDDNGDFYIEFVAAGRAGADGESGTADDTAASYAVYVQGAFNTDYQLEIVTAGTGQITKTTQNIFIETLGGEIDWLQTGGLSTSLTAYDLKALGFTGTTSGGVAVNEFVLQRIVSNLQNAFDQLGLDVNISTDPNEFEFQPFSTIFLSNSVDPINLTSETEFGYSQRSDPFNSDIEDEGVVFVSSFANLAFTPDEAGLTALSDAMTAAVGRRVGELMGLRLTTDTPNTSATFDIMAANSPDRGFYPGNNGSWQFLQAIRPLTTPTDSDRASGFVIGVQSSASLLERVLLRN